MKALVYTGPEQLEIRDVPSPEVPEGFDLVRIAHSGICGSDMHAYLGHDDRRPAPLILGHEAAGTVVGGEMDGRKVTINPLINCGTCWACTSGRTNICPERQIISMPPREGAFAEFVAMRRENLFFLPDDADTQKAALAEPLACGWHAVRLGQKLLPCDMSEARCLVLGGGAIGVGAALSLSAFGAQDITLVETNPLRRETLQGVGGFTVVDATGPDAPPMDHFDIVIDGVGFEQTRAAACAHARPGSVIVHIGLGSAEGGLDVRRMTLQEITFIGTYTYTAQDFRDTAQAIVDGRMGALDWMDIRPLDDGAAAFADIRSGQCAAPKIILTP